MFLAHPLKAVLLPSTKPSPQHIPASWTFPSSTPPWPPEPTALPQNPFSQSSEEKWLAMALWILETHLPNPAAHVEAKFWKAHC